MEPMLVFLLEERSAKEMLEGLLPRILGESGVVFRCVPFEGKQDLEKNIVRKIRFWRRPETHFVVLRDQDSACCAAVVERLKALCLEAGRPDSLVRIACRELESWYLGDLAAVEKGLNIPNLSKKQRKRTFREPDKLGNPSSELSRLTNKQYRKVAGSRAIGPHLNPENNRSYSFCKLVEGVRCCVERLNCDTST